MIQKLHINEEFSNKLECFECFRNLIGKEKFELIDENTQDIPLFRTDSNIWINVITKHKEKRARKYKFFDQGKIFLQGRKIYEKIDFLRYEEGYSLLFIEENSKYRFWGLYKMTQLNWDKGITKWEKQEIEEINLDEKEIKKLIRKLSHQDLKLWKESEVVIEKFDDKKIEEYVANKEQLKEILKQHGMIYKFLPDTLKNDEELAIIAIKSDKFGEVCRYLPKKFLQSMEFAQKIFQEGISGVELQYFSEEIKNNLEFCKRIVSLDSYPYMGENIHKNKEIALKLGAKFGNIKYVDKNLRKDKEIIDTYWEDLDFENLVCLCSIVSVDHFGNEVIDKFIEIEKTRHSKKRVLEYTQEVEFTQFVKIKEYEDDTIPILKVIDLDKEIFQEELRSVIVLVGKKENAISQKIKEEYQDHCIIEIYTQDTDTNHFKLITQDVTTIIDLLRVITYTNSFSEDIMPENYNGLAMVDEMLLTQIKKGTIEIYKYEGNLKEIVKKIREIPKDLVNQNCIIQIVGNEKIDAYICMNLASKLYKKKLYFTDIGYIASHICKIDTIEIILMKIV